MYRTHTCEDVTKAFNTQSITLCGWVCTLRDHGGVVFIDLTDRGGQVQLVCHPTEADVFRVAQALHAGDVIQVTGEVHMRPAGTVNPDLPSGEVEMHARQLKRLNASQPLPFTTHTAVCEEVRLRYRYLDLRRPEMQARFQFRARAASSIRRFLESKGFLELETPILTRATPEGARDYLVPSRTHPGQCFALPQSPQLFKQLFMVAGFDRYYQIARCFRDEDLRADRQPEFTQLDMEMSFVAESEVRALSEALIRHLFQALLDVALPDPFPVLSYAQAMQDYGSDKPDLRIPLKLVEVAERMQGVAFQVFAQAAQDADSRVAALRLPGGADLSRRALEDYTAYVSRFGAKGLAWLKRGAEGVQSPIAKFLPPQVIDAVFKQVGAQVGDIVFFGADKASVVNAALGALRLKLGQDLGLVETAWRPLWVIDFPLFEWDADAQRWQSLHHPFTAPKGLDARALAENPAQCLARAYDLVLNGTEIGGGSIRIHDTALQSTVFELLELDKQEAQAQFGFLLEALQYGCPPHGGIAFGLDRLIMLMSGASSIREVIAFPKTQTAHCPLTGAPTLISDVQLQALGIRRLGKEVPLAHGNKLVDRGVQSVPSATASAEGLP